jgi:hypothetical protein
MCIWIAAPPCRNATACGVSYDRAPDRETIIRNLLSGQFSNALRVVAFNAAEGWSRDVSEDIAGEVLERAFDADDNLPDDTRGSSTGT